MKNNMLIRAFLIYFLLFASLVLSAHPGGHYHQGDGTIFNTWQLQSGLVVKGNFSMGNADFILLEQEEGRILKIPIAGLSAQDQKLARFKIKKFERLNAPLVPPAEIPSRGKGSGWDLSYLLLTLILGLSTFLVIRSALMMIRKTEKAGRRFAYMAGYLSLVAVMAFACKKSSDSIIQTTPTTIPKTSTGFIDSAFQPYKPAVATRWNATYFYVESGGIPSHNMMVGITSWQQQVPIPQFFTGGNSWSIPLQPVYATVPMSTKTNFMKGAVALAVNGIPIFNALNNRGEDSYLIGELDNWGGHCGRADDYHYHAAPLHLSGTSGLRPIAFALDGFAVYGSKEPDGSSMQTLDTCHGHVGTNGVYHYHGTSTYPYVVGAMRGKVTTDITTPAPENQILPQAFASPLRPATSPLNGASITDFIATGPTGYRLTYKRGTKFGSVAYSWDNTNKYTFVFTDTAGVVTTSVYQR